MAALASVADLQKLMKRTFAGEDLAQAETVLDIVSAWARSVANQPWVDAPAGVPADVSGVVLTASRRELNSPNPMIKSKSKGPFSIEYREPPEDFFTKAELALLRAAAPRKNPGGLFKVSLSRGESRGASSYNAGLLYLDGDGGTLFPVFHEDDPFWGDSIHFEH